MSSGLAGKVVLVTGASRGIGRAIAVALAEPSVRLALVARTLRGLEGTLEEVKDKGSEAKGIACDVSKSGEVDRACTEIEREWEFVDVLVNNAGVVLRASVAQTTDVDFERVLGVNLAGPFFFARRLVPNMVKRRFGRVVNVSSLSGRVGTPRLSAYCASKWGLNGFTQALAAEVRGTGVTVNAVLPGSVDTDMIRGSGFLPDMSAADVAGVVRFLCADAPVAMTGSLVEVFG